MERKIGDTFEYEGKKLMVTEERVDTCEGCFFDGHCTRGNKALAGKCGSNDRDDGKNVVFMEVQEQQTEAKEQSPKLNLCEILKDCPKGEIFWSPLLGEVKLYCTDQDAEKVVVTAVGNVNWSINADGTIPIESFTSPEIMLYPSREQRDWSKFTAPWLKRERFDPKTLKPFDKVLSKYDGGCWSANLFSHIEEEDNEYYSTCSFVCNGSLVKLCIPYNDDTKHLVGTKDEAPEFYRYWED